MTNRPECLCGRLVNTGQVKVFGDIRVCLSGEHVLIGQDSATWRLYVHVENPSDVIERIPYCWLCGGVDPETNMKVAREYPGGPICEVYTTTVHTGCQERMSKEQP